MKSAWTEDIVSAVPQITFLLTLVFVSRPRTLKHPYGYHRASGIGHLVASVALVAVAVFLMVDALSGLLTGEHPTIGTVSLFGEAIWLGWLMMGVMALIVLPPILLARAKLKLAPLLNDKVLFADASMHKADWMTNAATVVGVAGIGVGLWWMDYAAALIISADILRDGIRNLRNAILDLMDRRATTHDLARPDPLNEQIHETLEELDWVDVASVRIRDLGRVFHVEAFVVPLDGDASLEELEDAEARCRQLEWTVQDVVITPVRTLPSFAEPKDRAAPQGQ